jgi:hypothetical protein
VLRCNRGGEGAWNLAAKSGETVNGQGMIVGVGKGRTHRVRGCYVTVEGHLIWRLAVARINNRVAPLPPPAYCHSQLWRPKPDDRQVSS